MKNASSTISPSKIFVALIASIASLSFSLPLFAESGYSNIQACNQAAASKNYFEYLGIITKDGSNLVHHQVEAQEYYWCLLGSDGRYHVFLNTFSMHFYEKTDLPFMGNLAIPSLQDVYLKSYLIAFYGTCWMNVNGTRYQDVRLDLIETTTQEADIFVFPNGSLTNLQMISLVSVPLRTNQTRYTYKNQNGDCLPPNNVAAETTTDYAVHGVAGENAANSGLLQSWYNQ